MTDSNESIQQAAALIVHDGRVCLVTASSGRRWILPKGTLERGQSPGECAVIEAWEEAGVRGHVGRRPVAKYAARKWGRQSAVSVFRLEVDAVAADWPERTVRRRRWVSLSQAIAAIDVPEVCELLRDLKNPKRKLEARPAER